MAIRIRKGNALDAINFTPLIDVVFQMLIYFLVVTGFVEEERSLNVQLPSASEAVPLIAEPKHVFVNIDQTGRYYVDGKYLDAAEVEDALQIAVTDNPANQAVVIRADRRVPFESVVVVMDICNRVGIRDYTVTTDEE